MRKNIAKVLAAFDRGVAAKGDSKGTCSTDGQAIYSYSLRIAHRDDTGRVHVISEAEARTRYMGWSMTTRSQIRACEFHFSRQALVEVARDAVNLESAAE